ncbi:membrane protein [Marinomonas sp. SBI22]|uniref:YeeE/YedE family protein n=1 Tax=unclassified Marinomonas TaxID=196814 RepID=UPI0007AFDC1D|nr:MULTISPECIES: YeeE/YedE family protein [unclassified Marinomonas]KZM42601.1 membrane protein [Marinomonas sp. SBI22]KZM43995.1 membrane protein [Marinomonas sp. SBI8L]
MKFINSGVIGGVLIGFAALLYLLLYGRVLGVSGLINQTAFNKSKEQGTNKFYLAMILIGTLIGGSSYGVFFEPQFVMPNDRSPLLLIIAGLIVGFGTRMGNGCTSGHGVCGISRGSSRSIVATMTFMVSAIITVYVTSRLFQIGA